MNTLMGILIIVALFALYVATIALLALFLTAWILGTDDDDDDDDSFFDNAKWGRK